ncbi:hypothetical protein FC83_GL001741 [Agrilactobacillus composti DSM 18527 = JCM 14202]|uniref:Citrate lyase acyl carrier protein n=2 Tax=Agrilactobacillus TaxID=2767875 RepID=A0A0R1XLH3_9LACO|nr:hypothetical protein FC83_GL001741 [Agrilactobacillus composti DSM 18527 = JCM 14202]
MDKMAYLPFTPNHFLVRLNLKAGGQTIMQLKHKAIAGTLESSDAQIILAPNDGGLHIDLTSSVYEQYGTQIKQLLQQVCHRLNIENANIRVVDKGALDCTLKARLETAYFRAIDQKVDINWEALS